MINEVAHCDIETFIKWSFSFSTVALLCFFNIPAVSARRGKFDFRCCWSLSCKFSYNFYDVVNLMAFWILCRILEIRGSTSPEPHTARGHSSSRPNGPSPREFEFSTSNSTHNIERTAIQDGSGACCIRQEAKGHLQREIPFTYGLDQSNKLRRSRTTLYKIPFDGNDCCITDQNALNRV